MIQHFRALRADRRGATAIEYGLIVASVGLASAGLMQSMGGSLLSIYNSILAAFAGAGLG